jgi:AcrR family transcriptional regulator
MRRRRRYHHGNLRQALLESALGLVRAEGVEGLTLRAVAARAGVSQAAPYRHFPDKQALLAAVAEEGFRAMTAAMRRARAPHAETPLARLRALGLAYVAFASSHPSHFRVMFGRDVADRSAHPSLAAAAAEAFDLLVEAIAECQRAGVVRAGDARRLALGPWAMMHGLASLLVDGQLQALSERSGMELAEDATQDLFLGLGPRPA